jgi:hypothetical protein
MSFEFNPNENPNRSQETMTHKTLKAMWVVKDSLVEFPADPKLEPPIDPKDNP